jgi:hypothetical protein
MIGIYGKRAPEPVPLFGAGSFHALFVRKSVRIASFIMLAVNDWHRHHTAHTAHARSAFNLLRSMCSACRIGVLTPGGADHSPERAQEKSIQATGFLQ